MIKQKVLLVLPMGLAVVLVTLLASQSPVLAQSVNEFVSGSVVKNSSTQNALTLVQGNTVSNGRADGGALLVNNSGNKNTGLTLYSNQSAPTQPLMRMEIDNPSWSEEVLYIKSDSPTSRGLIRLDSPAPEIEFVETDQSGAKGKFEIRVQHGEFQFNSRRGDDTTFENKMSMTQDGDLELVSGSLNILGDAPSTFKGGINIVGGCLAFDGTCVGGEALLTTTGASDSKGSSNSNAKSNSVSALAVKPGAPADIDCNSFKEQGTMMLDAENNRLYICNGPERGWDYTALSN